MITVALPREISAIATGDALAESGLLLSYRSDYLLERNWIQICLMGAYSVPTIDRLLAALAQIVTPRFAFV